MKRGLNGSNIIITAVFIPIVQRNDYRSIFIIVAQCLGLDSKWFEVWIQILFDEVPNITDVREYLQSNGFSGAQVIEFGNPKELLVKTDLIENTENANTTIGESNENQHLSNTNEPGIANKKKIFKLYLQKVESP